MAATSGGPDLTVREVARRVQRAEETIRRWIWAGKLPARKVLGAYRVRERDLEAVAGSVPVPDDPARRDAGLGRWVADVRAWRVDNGVPARSGAGELVAEDRAERSERGTR